MAKTRREVAGISCSACAIDESEFEPASCVELDVSLIPDYAKEELSEAGYEMVQNILMQPGGREMLDAITATRKLRKAAK